MFKMAANTFILYNHINLVIHKFSSYLTYLDNTPKTARHSSISFNNEQIKYIPISFYS